MRFLLPDPVLQVPEAERRATMWKAPSEKPDLLQVDGVGAFVRAPGAVSAAPKLGGDPLAPTAEGMRGRVADGWKHFRATVERVTGEGLERPTASGWTRKQMLAHIGVWHLITAERLRRACEEGTNPPPPDDEDAVNADAATTASDLAASTVLRDLDASFETLWQELASLDDTMVQANDGWAEAIVMGNTSGHYAEHLGELEETTASV